MQTLSRPCFQPSPSRRPSSSPGLPTSPSQATVISAATCRKRSTSTPISAAGTIPNIESAE